MIGPTPVPRRQHDKDQQTQRRNGPSSITETDDEERTTIGVTNENAERDGDSRGNPDRRHGIGEVLKQQIPNPSRALPSWPDQSDTRKMFMPCAAS